MGRALHVSPYSWQFVNRFALQLHQKGPSDVRSGQDFRKTVFCRLVYKGTSHFLFVPLQMSRGLFHAFILAVKH